MFSMLSLLVPGTGFLMIWLASCSPSAGLNILKRPPVTSHSPVVIVDVNPTSGKAPLKVSFDASKSYARESGATIVSFEWDFDGDGRVDLKGSSPLAAYEYKLSGSFFATVTVLDSRGYSSSAVVYIFIVNQPPKALFSIGSYPRVPELGPPLDLIFTASGSSDPDGKIILYEWDFNGDSLWDVASQWAFESNWHYSGLKNYPFDVTLRVTDNGGLTDTFSVTFPDERPHYPPVVIIDVHPTSGKAPLKVSFDASKSYPREGEATIASFEWDFDGDGRVDLKGSSPLAAYEYKLSGSFFATVTVLDSRGYPSWAILKIYVIES